MKKSDRTYPQVSQPAGPVYIFGGLGAFIYYVSIADGFWQIVLAFLKSIVWPAFAVHDLLKFLA